MDVISLEDGQIDIEKILNQLELISSLSEDKKKVLIEHVSLLQLDNQEIFMNKGDIAEDLYVVYSGRLAAFKDNENWQESIVGFIRQSEIIGELALISNLPRQTGVVAMRRSILIRIPNSVIKEFMLSEPQLTLKISSLITERMNRMLAGKSTFSYTDNIQIISVFPAGNSSSVLDFINQFVPILSVHKKCITFASTSFLELLNKENSHLALDSANFDLYRSRCLAGLENKYDFIFLIADEHLSEWSLFCLKNSDSFFYIAEENAEKNLNPMEGYIQENSVFFSKTDKKLICVHRETQGFITGTSEWLETRGISCVHHVCPAQLTTYERFSRILRHKSISLVLSGGGLLGMAHIGAIRAIREAGIEIDAVSGVSCGAVIAALYALHLDEKLLDSMIERIIKRRKKFRFFMWQVPLISLLKPYYTKKIFYELFREAKIEDLWIPFVCVACNLSTTEDSIFDQGSLVDAVLASNSLPGVLSPTLINGQLYIDGGVSNTMPVDVMKEKFGGITIAVNVSQKREIEIDNKYQRFPSTWEILINSINPFKHYSYIPFIHEIIGQTIIIGNKRKLAQVKAITDYLIEPDFTETGRITHKKVPDLIELGYQQAKEIVKNWPIAKKPSYSENCSSNNTSS